MDEGVYMDRMVENLFQLEPMAHGQPQSLNLSDVDLASNCIVQDVLEIMDELVV